MTPGAEVEIVCLADTAHIRDLGLKMVRGARVTTTLSAISRSSDLEWAKAQGLVGVKVMKAHTIRPENLPEPSPNARTISRSAAHPAGIHSPVVPTVVEVDQTPILKALRELSREVRELREELRKRPDADSIAFAVKTALSGTTFATSGKEVSLPIGFDQPEERFIPRGIVSGTAKQDIETSRSTTGGVEDAEAALREARKRRSNGEKDG